MATGFGSGLVKGTVLGAAALAALSLVTPQPEADPDATAAVVVTGQGDVNGTPQAEPAASPEPTASDVAEVPAEPVVTPEPSAETNAADGLMTGATDGDAEATAAPSTNAAPSDAPPSNAAMPIAPQPDATPEDAPPPDVPEKSVEPQQPDMPDDEAPEDAASAALEDGADGGNLDMPSNAEPREISVPAPVIELPLTVLDPPDVAALAAASPAAPVAPSDPASTPPASPDQAPAATADQPELVPVVPAFQQTIDSAPPDLSAPLPAADEPTAPGNDATPVTGGIDLSLPPDLDRLSAPQAR